MKRKRDVFDFFKDNQHRLDETPPAHSWRRLERRLDTHQQRNRLSRHRMLGMAAGVLVLITLVGLVALSLGRQQSRLLASGKQAAPAAVEDLALTDADRGELRAVLTVQQAQEHRQRPISEGAPGQKLVLSGDSTPGGESAGVTLQAFSWMTGRWQSREQGRPAFEEWRQTGENELAGQAGFEDEGQTREHMRLYRQGNKIYFSTDFGGTAATSTSYALAAINGEEALFENLEAGFPQQVLLQRQGPARFAVIYQNAEFRLPDTERFNNLRQRHTIRPMQAVRRLSRVGLQ